MMPIEAVDQNIDLATYILDQAIKNVTLEKTFERDEIDTLLDRGEKTT